MLRKLICAAILAFILLAGTALASDEYPQPYTGDLVGAWAFAGGAEEHGDGFRLYADGTGVWLEIVDYEQLPLQYRETDSTFTWEIVREADKTLLVETESDGRVFTYEIETYGSACIHIPNEWSGGFYYPLLDDEARAYLADKTAFSAFDGVLADYLDGSITGKLEAVGLPVNELYLQQDRGAWRIVFGVYDREKKLDYRFVLDEEYVTVLADEAGWLWGDYDLGQPWFAPRETERYYTMLPGILESYLTWEYNTPQPTQKPARPALPELTAQLGSFPKKQTYEVYEVIFGEAEANRRAGNGKAKVSTNGDVWVYAAWRNMLLVEYEVSEGRHRIGWIDADPLPDSALQGVPELTYSWDTEENTYGVVHSSAFLTDDPQHSQNQIAPISAGTSVHVLARLGDWYLVQGFVNQELRMGFIQQDKVDLEHGYSANPVWEIGCNTRYTEADVQAAFDALARCIYQSWPGTGLVAVRYDENDADYADPNPWWTDDTGTLEGILLLADLSSMEMVHHEIAGILAKDYIFILHREPGGEWEVVNWGYT